ncbi:dual specificity phosphatase [Anaeramoeba ignava]|uniref:protein-tyrosine-phosphatase n=1 Tax=Anaeramoeba ignava TaxID=1746090 RepID=A0A9Q0LNV8_ANAIG|nr:dual specificity phosphatase [Anaeramoeba ignava]
MISSQQIYNYTVTASIQQSLVLDFRDSELFQKMAIKLSVNLPAKEIQSYQGDLFDLVLSKISNNFFKSNLKRKAIRSIIFIDSIENEKENQESISKLKKAFENHELTNILTLEGGIEKTYEEYPVIFGTWHVKNIDPPTIHLPIHNFPSEIIKDFLYLGDYRGASNLFVLQTLKISRILNCCDECENVYENDPKIGIKYFKIPVDDKPSEPLNQFFEKAYDWIEEARNLNERVLVHCQMGISRSSSVVISYIMKKNSLNFEDARVFVYQNRPAIRPGFHQQLQEYEQKILIKEK